MDINLKKENLKEYYNNQKIYEKYADSSENFRLKYTNYYIAQLKHNLKADEKEKEKKNAIIISISVFFVALLILSIYTYKKEKKASENKEIDIINKEKKLSTLELKLNDAFKEVLELAKNDDPSFLSRFKEVYPEFYSKLSTSYPELTISQLRFCCMLKLNFSTKEIAHYHHLTIKGVQVKKNRLRKILDVPSEIDLNKWMMEF